MRLRLRSHETRRKQKIEVPNTCTVHQLQQVISPSSPSSIHFSLNRRDELAASSPDDSLHSLGITAGDLVYYSRDPMAFISPSQTLGSTSSSSVQAMLHSGSTSAVETEDSVKLEGRDEEMEEESPVQDWAQNQASGSWNNGFMFDDSDVARGYWVSGLNFGHEGTLVGDFGVQDQLEDVFVSSIEKGKTSIQEDTEAMHVDDEYLEIAGWKFSEPCFLRRVLTDELGYKGSQHKLLVAVHAVLLESGFVGFDSLSGRRVDRFNLPDKSPSTVFSLSLWYTLPELLSTGSNATESIVLKFQKLGHFVNVYGSLANGDSGLYRVCLDEHRFLPAINLIWENCDKNGRMDDEGKHLNLHNETVVFDFWRMVKDGISLPLLIDLCDKAGLLLPACLMRLPTELKVKILESLPGIDIAKMGCVCTEMRYIASSNDLWKQKVVEEFGSRSNVQGYVHWKNKFAMLWRERKIRDSTYTPRLPYGVIDGRPPSMFPVLIDSGPPRFPVIWRDDGRYEFPSPFGLVAPRHYGYHGCRNFSPRCNLGGF